MRLAVIEWAGPGREWMSAHRMGSLQGELQPNHISMVAKT